MTKNHESNSIPQGKSTGRWYFDHVFCPWFSIGALGVIYQEEDVLKKLFGFAVLAYTAYVNIPTFSTGENSDETQLSGMKVPEPDLMR